MTVISASDARASLPELLTRVEDGEEVTITRHGRAVAVLVSPRTLRSRRADATLAAADRLHALVEEAATAPLPPTDGLTERRAEELVTAIRAEREAR